ncbi:nitrate/sulfonate/bicarbonate ABC transporter ATP-binding protein [Salipaludibacillus keqinensis]|uniref:Nitrate/sulfonate/bicarbonate ABC transporter ATP-binding protein n=1 Tax=Salipaludibacillus keqinensis TaxID=2045207 RepID=A0A323THZ7_9BACI|nr:ABC transporter ATP-binding protein [Salipaludibacillus keqinensis]PYZ94752.1 nitrate/sulfonate/bicarbonate ABC transporter ATP-binding protein [Salipaludibacillus keqinensis]
MTVKTKNVLVNMSGLSKIFPNGTTAVKDVNLEIKEGEFICFVGPSGCGKSTIFKMITGLEDHTNGELEIFGHSPDEARKQNEVAFVFQDHTLLPWKNVRDNVALPLQLKGVSKKERYAEAERVLELVGLAHTTTMLPRELSGGMKMRVSIARALVTRPRLLLMDEPFGALDEITRQSLQEELLNIWQKDSSMTVLFITHNVFEAVYLSSKVAVMTPGPGKISSNIEVPYAYPRGDQFRTTPEFGELVGDVSKVLDH